MSIWTLSQIVFNLVMFVGFVSFWLRLRRPPQDDPRLSKGLQLLQTKITVLEDLSDRTDAQVKQLSALLDQKTRIVQNKILEAEQQVLKIDHSMSKSLEVAEIFQDKIPHQEILERQRTVEYVKAARMAHSGMNVEEIVQAVHLPREQVELIAKFNRDQLMFDETQLPEWATRPVVEGDPAFALNRMDFVGGLELRPTDLTPSNAIENGFRRAVADAREADAQPPGGLLDTAMAESLRSSLEPAANSIRATANSLKQKIVTTAEDLLGSHAPSALGPPSVRKVSAPIEEAVTSPTFTLGKSTSSSNSPLVRKVIFPRLEK